MSMDLNKIYERIIGKLIVPKYDFITGIEALKVEKDEIDRISLRINFYLSASWADTMFTNDCRGDVRRGGSTVILHMADMDDCVLNGFYYEKTQIVEDLENINKMLGYKTNYYKVSFDIRFVIDFDN